LEYSPKKDAAYCFACRMFSGTVGLNAGQSDEAFSKLVLKIGNNLQQGLITKDQKVTSIVLHL